MLNQRAHKYTGFNPPPSHYQAAWAIALFAGLTLGAAAGGFGFGYLAKSINVPAAPLVTIGVVIGAAISASILLHLSLVRKFGWGWKEFGLIRPRHSLWHLLWWIPLTIITGGIGAMLIGTSQGLDPTDGESASEGFQLGIIAGIVIFLGTAIVLPFFEEVIFRRVLMDWLNLSLPTWLAAALVTILFTAAHINPAIMLYVFFLGTSLILARIWFQSMLAPLLIHMANNAIVTLAALTAL